MIVYLFFLFQLSVVLDVVMRGGVRLRLGCLDLEMVFTMRFFLGSYDFSYDFFSFDFFLVKSRDRAISGCKARLRDSGGGTDRFCFLFLRELLG